MDRRDVPLDLVVLADLGIPAEHAAVGRVRLVEPDDLAPWMAALAPGATVTSGGATIHVSIPEPRGFRPEALAARLPEAAALLELRRRLAQQGIVAPELEQLVGGLPDASPLKQALRRVIAESEAPAPSAPPAAAVAPPAPRPAPAPEGGELDAIFSMVDTPGADPGAVPTSPERRALERLVRELASGGRGGAVVRTATQRGLAATVDAALADTLRPVLHAPAFAALEQAWSGLRFLLRRVDRRSGIRVHVLPTTRALLERHVRDALAPFAEDQRREGRVVAAIADFDLGADPAALAPLAAALARVQTPLVAGLDPALLGIASMAELDTIDDLAARLDDADHAGWAALRRDENARWLFLAANRFLMRLPYGAEHDRVKDFAFEENPEGHEPAWAWARASWAVGERIAASGARCGWGVELLGQAEDVPLGDLPVRMMRLKTGDEVPVALEALLPERRALELSQCGIVALLCRRDADQAFLASAPSVHRAPAGREARTSAEARRDSLPFAMFVAQVGAALAHLWDRTRAEPDELAAALERGSATREGPVIEVRAAGDALSVTPWRDPVRGLPGFTLPLSALR